jgi:hypothetical protein
MHMLAQVLNRAFVLDQLAILRAELEGGSALEEGDAYGAGVLEPAPPEETLHELRAVEAREAAGSSGQPAFALTSSKRRGAPVAPIDDFSFISRDPLVGLVQSAIEEYIVQREPELVDVAGPADDRRRRPEDDIAVTDRVLSEVDLDRAAGRGRRLFGRFEPADVRWASCLVAMAVRRRKGLRPFNERPAAPAEIADQARLVLVGDWGTGVPRARKVADRIRRVLEDGRKQRREQHVVHLGDAYYSGWEREYEQRFLAHWPVHPGEGQTFGSWSLNGNHDMYSGGHGYFDYLLADQRFRRQEQSSFFTLDNAHWLVLALDTAYEEHDLRDPQARWVAKSIAAAPGKKTILLSHHQLFSAYEHGGPKLAKKLSGPLRDGSIDAWFWGHEHRCAVYAPHEGVSFARCVGHGGVPVYMTHREKDPYPQPAVYEFRKVLRDRLEPWAAFGFVVLDFDGPRLHVRYLDEDGAEHHTEEIE